MTLDWLHYLLLLLLGALAYVLRHASRRGRRQAELIDELSKLAAKRTDDAFRWKARASTYQTSLRVLTEEREGLGYVRRSLGLSNESNQEEGT